MAATTGRTGRAGNLTLSSQIINITKWDAKLNVAFADSTDSGNYSAPALFKSQLNGDQQIEGSIEGNFDASTTSTNVTALLKVPSSGPYALVLKYDASLTCFSGNADFSDLSFSVSVPGATMITFTASYKSNGSFTFT
jgi:hypothetical protein